MIRNLSEIPVGRDEEAEDYEYLRDVIIEELNPRDDDVAEVSILELAIRNIARYVREQTFCTCVGPDEVSCLRCSALGRHMDVPVDG